MGKFTRMIYLTAAMAATAVPGFAEEPVPVTPPLLEPQEEWVLQFDNYMNEYGDRASSRDVVIVRDESDMYIKGVFAEYPDAWLKGTVDGNHLRIDNKQFLDKDEDGGDVYFYCGSFESTWASGNTFQDSDKDFRSNDQYGIFAIADDGNAMTPVRGASAFWYTAGKSKISFFEHIHFEGFDDENHEVWITTGTGFPDVDYMIHMRFQKKGESGVVGIGGDSADESAAPMYNLQGQAVDPATAGPGIYIQGGKKIVKTGR